MEKIRMLVCFIRHEQGFPRKVAGLSLDFIDVIPMKEQSVMKASCREPLPKLFKSGG